ncbi:MAG: hypothetical protein E6614_28055, partial [Bradyrhizobium sp.]|nr:hypothetical protein [Bradyrhizobium sp.]
MTADFKTADVMRAGLPSVHVAILSILMHGPEKLTSLSFSRSSGHLPRIPWIEEAGKSVPRPMRRCRLRRTAQACSRLGGARSVLQDHLCTIARSAHGSVILIDQD